MPPFPAFPSSDEHDNITTNRACAPCSFSPIRSGLLQPYAYFSCSAFTRAHRARCDAAIFLPADANIVRLGFALLA